MTKLSVNLNKIALLRNARGRDFPNLTEFANWALAAGADGLTIHPRPDQRHARYADIATLKSLCEPSSRPGGVELNIEGYPEQALIDLCIRHRPHQVTLVPDAPDQLTSDHGWQVSKHEALLRPILQRLRDAGIRSSLFMDLSIDEIHAAKAVGADRIELHTESYARSFEQQTHEQHIRGFVKAYQTATAIGMGVNAGHDLNLDNLAFFLAKVPVQEVSIGHALTVEALIDGWQPTITRYKNLCQ